MPDPFSPLRQRELDQLLEELFPLLMQRLTGGGTFTPTLVPGGSGSFTVTSSGFWSRVGPLIFVRGSIDITGTSSPAGSVAIGNLPFTARSEADERNLLTVGSPDFINLSDGYTAVHGLILPNTDSALLREGGDNVAAQSIQAAAVGTSTAFSFAGWYEAAQ